MIPAVFITNDRDLLDLEKPFGVPVMTPVQFLRFVRERSAVRRDPGRPGGRRRKSANAASKPPQSRYFERPDHLVRTLDAQPSRHAR